jgi:hypothetical protein
MMGPFVFQSDAAGLQLIAARAPRDPMMPQVVAASQSHWLLRDPQSPDLR